MYSFEINWVYKAQKPLPFCKWKWLFSLKNRNEKHSIIMLCFSLSFIVV